MASLLASVSPLASAWANQDAAERILVQLGQCCQLADMRGADGERGDPRPMTYFSHQGSGSATSAPGLRNLTLNGDSARAAPPRAAGSDSAQTSVRVSVR